MLVFHALFGAFAANAAPPAWWTAGSPPVVDTTITAPDKNHAVATIGQAKWMAEKALRALEADAPQIAAQIRSDLQGRGPSDPDPTPQIVDLTVPATKTVAWIEKQKAPLQLGQLKSVAAPFYKRLAYSAYGWLDNETSVVEHKGQLQLNGTKAPGSIYPWTTTASDDANTHPATIGQLKNVFSLRFDTLAEVPPYTIEYPTFLSGVSLWNTTLAGQTLTVEPGKWNSALGFEVTGYWYDIISETKVGLDNDPSYTVTAADVTAGAVFVWRETATHGGVTETLDNGWVEALPLDFFTPNPPSPSYHISGSHAPGVPLTRVDSPYGPPSWSDPFEGLAVDPSLRPITVSPIWYKNGVSTGETSATYSGTTSDGDIIQYRETATNGAGSYTHVHARFAVSSAVAAYQNEKHAQFSPLIAGKTGGAADMDIFSSVDHTVTTAAPMGTYTRNANLWAAPLVPQLTGAVAWRASLWVESHGGILITPRHVLYCEHSHPYANGTFIYPIPDMKLRFVLEDNSVVEATQLCQSDQKNPANPGWISSVSLGGGVDLCVAVLDKDVETLGAHVVRIPRIRTPEEYSALLEFSSPFFAISQGYGRSTTDIPPTPISDYPQYHKSMANIRTDGWGRAAAPYDNFDYAVWKGDSGTPQFLLHRGEVYLQEIISGASTSLNIDKINHLIGAADAGAVAMGRLETVTGLTVTPKVLPSD